jgi:hypothetical protein
MKGALLAAALAWVAASAVAASSGGERFDRAFRDRWMDGKAELSGYDLMFPRYGEERRGTAVLIFVTEPFSEAKRIKADPGKNPKSDEFQVMKLNLARDFPTGVYDYNLMTSVFLGLEPFGGRPAGTPAKVSFSAQEWCGQAYEHVLFRRDAVEALWHSYFDGEADGSVRLPLAPEGASEDALFLWARGWAEPHLKPGESRDVPLLMSLATSRLKHVPLAWRRATLARGPAVEDVTVPAGTFRAEKWTASVEGGPAWTFHVEAVEPHRILRWETSEGEKGELLKSERLTYWEMNAERFRKDVSKLGLFVRPPRTQ